MSPGKAPAVLMPDSGIVDRLVITILIPCDRPTHGFQNRWCYSRHVFDRFTFVQLLYLFLTDIPLRAFCLLTLAVQYLPLEREAPQGGLETLPVKRIRETNSGFIVSLPWIPLISSKVMMNQFQRTYFLINRKISIFESVLIHRRTHARNANNGS